MSDRIYVKDLLLRTIIGIDEEERDNLQDVVVNLTLYADTRAAGVSDDIEDAVNYRTITKRVIKLVEESRFYLVEKLVAEIAILCLEDPRVERATVRVEKPGALRFTRSVSVEIDRSRADMKPTNRVFLSLGSNITPEQNLKEAVQQLAARSHLLAVSPVYETLPVGTPDQPNFLNAAALIETHLTPAELKTRVLQAIEEELGRVRTADRNAPRTIDLDICLFGDQVLEVENRHIPSPEILQYAHIARPLADLAPHQRHPDTGQTLLEIAQGLSPSGMVRRSDLVLWPLPIAD